MIDREFFTVQEIAEIYSVSRTAVYAWIEKGLRHSFRREIGKKEHIVISREDVDNFSHVGIFEKEEK